MRHAIHPSSLTATTGLILAVSLGVVISSTPCRGQIVNATLYGTVSDPAGFAIPDARVIATDVATGIATQTMTDTTGNYTFPSLSPATYSITVRKTGFESSIISGITLLVNQKAHLDIGLRVGQVTTSVEVKGTAPLVETGTASVGTVIEERNVVDLPLNLRRFGALATLVPGTTGDNGGFASAYDGSPFSETTYAANGARTSSNNTLIDGADSRNLSFGGFALQPSPDAVQEFKIETNIYSAAFGKTAGSTINLVTKAGTNELHGSVYEFLRNDALDAGNFFSLNQANPLTDQEIPGTRRPEYRRNQFGFSIGGPVRKNKTFFFGNYEEMRQIKGLSLTAVLPTANELSGDFGGALTGNVINLCGTGGPANLDFDSGQLFDPITESLFTCPAGSANAGSAILVGQPIPGNILTSLDPVAQKLISLGAFPDPNRPGYPNYVNQEPATRFDHQFLVRIDHNFSMKDQLFGRYMFGQSAIFDPSLGYDVLPGFEDKINFRGQNLGLIWTHTFNPHLLNQGTFAFQRDYTYDTCAHCPRPAGFMEGLGIKNLGALDPKSEEFPFFGLSNFSGVGDAGYMPTISPDMVEKYQDNLTWLHGRHTVVVGADLQFWQVLGMQSSAFTNGQFYYDGQFSGIAGEVPDASGVADLADFLLGFPSFAGRTVRFENLNQVGGWMWNYYAQDDFKISSNFTLNVGLRWEYRRSGVDKRNNLVTFVPLGPKFSGPGNGILVSAADGTVNDSFCTDPSYSYLTTPDGRCLVATSAERAKLGFTGRTQRTLVQPFYGDWAPRLGLSWRPTSSDKLVIHTGYGIFYDLANFNNLHFVDNNPIFSPTQLYNTAYGSPPPLTNGLPTTMANVFAGAAGIPGLSQQFVSLYVSPNYQAPYVQEWSFGIQSQLARDWALEVDYIGTKGTKLGNLHLFGNQPEPGVGDLQPRRPYPDFNQMLFTSPDANSLYNSLQAKLTKRFSGGFTFLASYTWAHSIDENEGDEGFGGGVGNNAPQDDNNLRADRGRSVNDARHRFTISYIWQVPIGSGKRFLNRGGWLDQVLGSWELSGITTFESGFPFSVLSPDFSNSGTLNSRPDRVCNGTGKKTVEQWFDTNCFPVAALEQALASGSPRFGNAGRNILNGPGLNSWDLALLKDFKLTERLKLQFRAEGYNIFNSAPFGSPFTVITAANVGAIYRAGDPRDIQFGLKLSF